VKATVIGVAALTAALQEKQRAARAAASGALNKVAGVVHNESQRRVPVDTGNLKGSARIAPSTASDLTAVISYGGTASAYALVVHETHRGKSKFLEAPARENASYLASEVGKAIKGATG
jgi:hypothetical protein